MTARTRVELGPKGILGANVEMGLYLYSPPIAPFGTSDEMRPACIVHRTRSDRRLGTHLLSAIELMLPLLVDESQWRADVALSSFPPARPKDGGEGIAHLFPTSSLMYFRMIHMLSPDSDQAEWACRPGSAMSMDPGRWAISERYRLPKSHLLCIRRNGRVADVKQWIRRHPLWDESRAQLHTRWRRSASRASK